VSCLSLLARNTTWTPEVIRQVPLRQWRYLPVLFEIVAEMSNPERPGNGR
jgi:hypothetical protein